MISGPGGTLYGPNAVNGVVNFITRDAHDTLGLLARATVGDEERTLGARFGAPLGADGAVRVYGHYYDREDLPEGLGPPIDDRFRGWQAGFRSDFAGSADHFTFQGDIFDSDTGGLPSPAQRPQSAGALTREYPTGRRSAAGLLRFFDRDSSGADSLQTFDVEVLQRRAAPTISSPAARAHPPTSSSTRSTSISSRRAGGSGFSTCSRRTGSRWVRNCR